MANGEIFISPNSDSKTALNKFFYYMTDKDVFRIKIRGFDAKGQHLKLASSRPGILSIEQSSRTGQLEQTIIVRAKGLGIATIHAYDSASSSGAYLGYCPPTIGGVYKNCFPTLTVNVLSKIKRETLADGLSENERAMLMVLLAETKTPSAPGLKYNEKDAVKSMQYMRRALLNRFTFSHPNRLDVPMNNKTLVGLIRVERVIAGFSNYPGLSKDVNDHIDGLIKAANMGQNKYFLENRLLIKYAIDVARGKELHSSLPHIKDVYGWRTQGKEPPGGGYKYIFSLAGQDFYGLEQSFIDDPNQRKKK
ncbi:hypothetical protein [Escherichia coli]|uniref:hypothetical protein n=1 Tax=Escherichia coli TaxID=562 RepID=UPI0021C066BA|nr:hypothetical protein [Escherichia coli]MCT8918765.1 hypothetical protein [Escherichia coli]HAW0505543.1 hypothetical protein [Escherichia coli]HAW4280144.1 hypothetical protein [Escherichia coli]HAW4293754.1 hypothetical protein [Escherichia coli]HBB9640796.1 hypothetical protein [Escherichia coli]